MIFERNKFAGSERGSNEEEKSKCEPVAISARRALAVGRPANKTIPSSSFVTAAVVIQVGHAAVSSTDCQDEKETHTHGTKAGHREILRRKSREANQILNVSFTLS